LYHQLKLKDYSNISFELERVCQLPGPNSGKIRADLTVLENNKPILNIRVKNYRRMKGRTQLWSHKDYKPTKTIEKYLRTGIPLFLCENFNAIDKTLKFVDSWIKKEKMELYKLYPNKIEVINRRVIEGYRFS